MCMVEYRDGGWLTLSEGARRAKKAHRCDDCGRDIAVGEQYHYLVGLSEGDFYTAKQCAHCRTVASWLQQACGGWLYTAVREDLEEHWTDSPEYRSHYLGRAILGIGRKWSRRDGTLMRVPQPFTGTLPHEHAA